MTVTTQPEFIESTAGQVAAELARRGISSDERVRIMVGRPSLSIIARQLQASASANGMTEIIHNDLWTSLKNDS